jgi:hypothetical protein
LKGCLEIKHIRYARKMMNIIRKILRKCNMQEQAFPKITNLPAANIAPLPYFDGFRTSVTLMTDKSNVLLLEE